MFRKKKNTGRAPILNTDEMIDGLEEAGIESGQASAIVSAISQISEALCQLLDQRLGLQRNVLLVLGGSMLCMMMLPIYFIHSISSKLDYWASKMAQTTNEFRVEMRKSQKELEQAMLKGQKEFEQTMLKGQKELERSTDENLNKIVAMLEQNNRDIIENRLIMKEIKGMLVALVKSGEDGGLKKSSDKPVPGRNGAGIGFPAPAPGARPFPWGCPWPWPQEPDGPFAGKPPGIGIGPGTLAPRMRGEAPPPPAAGPPFTGIRFDGALGGY